MPKLKCDVKQCKYNCDSLCSKQHIDVDGINSKSKKDTQCSSFEYCNPSDYNYEFSTLEQKPTEQTEVYCDVIQCVFERGQKCYADKVVIKNLQNSTDGNKTTAAITHCQTFESKD